MPGPVECTNAIVHHIGIALGGRPAASLARRLMLPVSRDALLRVVRRRDRLEIWRIMTVGIGLGGNVAGWGFAD